MAKTAGSQNSWFALACLAGLCGAQACLDGADEPADSEWPIGDLLANIGPLVVLPALEAHRVDLVALESTLEDQRDGAGDQATSQDAWATAMATAQILELFQIGPAGDSIDVIGGLDLRDELYSWPTVNGCRIDQETVEEQWSDPGYFDANLVNSYGLDALEHLLFADLDNSCPSQMDIDGLWEDLGDSGVQANRLAFALALTQGALAVVADLAECWATDGGDFSGLLTATTVDSPYSSPTEALNGVFDALFYLDSMTKDRKLAQPLGLTDCLEDRCLDDVEGLLSGTGLASLENNLLGFQTLFTGGEGDGVDDLLDRIGHGDLADAILENTAQAIATAAALDGPLDQLIAEQPDTIEQLHGDLKAITDLLKGDLATVLALRVPSEVSGDND
jgi:predicted lipoprotein